jgi:hypothetical protein
MFRWRVDVADRARRDLFRPNLPTVNVGLLSSRMIVLSPSAQVLRDFTVAGESSSRSNAASCGALFTSRTRTPNTCSSRTVLARHHRLLKERT